MANLSDDRIVDTGVCPETQTGPSCGQRRRRDHRTPATVRGPDVAFFSYPRIPGGRLPKRGYLEVAPDLAIEVKSEFDRWSEISEKIAEYLKAGVLVVCVVDPDTDSVQVHYPDKAARVFQADDELVLPEVLPDFRVTVRELFE